MLPSVEPWGDETTTHQCVTITQPGHPDAAAFGSHFNGRGEHLFAFTGSPAQLRHAFYGGGAGWRLSDRSLANGPVHIAVRGRCALDDAVFADQAAALIDTQRRFWDDPHASAQAEAQWLVLTPNFVRGNVGGTLVHQAAVLHAGADFSPSHPSFAFLIGHENLHQWIPGRFGAQGGDEPLRERHDWFSEGFSD